MMINNDTNANIKFTEKVIGDIRNLIEKGFLYDDAKEYELAESVLKEIAGGLVLDEEVILRTKDESVTNFYKEHLVFMPKEDILELDTPVVVYGRKAIIAGDDRDNSLLSLSNLNYYIKFTDVDSKSDCWYDDMVHYSDVTVEAN